MKSVCIVLVNYRGHDDTMECLESVWKSGHTNFQVVVVDNSETIDSFDRLRKWASGQLPPVQTRLPEYVLPPVAKPIEARFLDEEEFAGAQRLPERLLVVRAKRNLGFAAGNNIALRYAVRAGGFDFVWLLNNDTVIQSDTLSSLVNCAGELPPNVGMIGGKLRRYDDRSRLQAMGGTYYKWFGKVREIGANEPDQGQWDQKTIHPDYIIGASMFVRTEFVKSVGLMEEDYFIYFEELDWSLRGAAKGWTTGVCPAAVVYHKLGASTGSKKTISEISDFYFVRNRILVARKFFPFTLLTLLPAFSVFIIRRLLMGKPERILMLVKLIFNPSQHYVKR